MKPHFFCLKHSSQQLYSLKENMWGQSALKSSKYQIALVHNMLSGSHEYPSISSSYVRNTVILLNKTIMTLNLLGGYVFYQTLGTLQTMLWRLSRIMTNCPATAVMSMTWPKSLKSGKIQNGNCFWVFNMASEVALMSWLVWIQGTNIKVNGS